MYWTGAGSFQQTVSITLIPQTNTWTPQTDTWTLPDAYLPALQSYTCTWSINILILTCMIQSLSDFKNLPETRAREECMIMTILFKFFSMYLNSKLFNKITMD